VINFDDSWNVHDRRRTFLYCAAAAADPAAAGSLGYLRWTDYATGEVAVKYRDAGGTWVRKTFTSRADDVTITLISSSDTGTKVNLTISVDDFASMPRGRGDEVNMQYKKVVDDQAAYIGAVAHTGLSRE